MNCVFEYHRSLNQNTKHWKNVPTKGIIVFYSVYDVPWLRSSAGDSSPRAEQDTSSLDNTRGTWLRYSNLQSRRSNLDRLAPVCGDILSGGQPEAGFSLEILRDLSVRWVRSGRVEVGIWRCVWRMTCDTCWWFNLLTLVDDLTYLNL